MQTALNYIKITLATLFGIIINLLGGWDAALQSLLTLTVLDFITGITTGIVNKNLSSVIAVRGIAKKIGIYTLIAVSVVGSTALGNEDLRSIIITFFIISEIISIVENWAEFGVIIPPNLKDFLGKFRK